MNKINNKGFGFEITENNKDEWLTPPSIIKALGDFDLDPCTPINRPWDTAKEHYNILDDGLNKPWFGRVWCNPPYGNQTSKWMQRMSKHNNGIALIFARTETKTFFENIWPYAYGIFFFKGRIAFHHVNGKRAAPSGAPSVLIAYGESNFHSILEAANKNLILGKSLKL